MTDRHECLSPRASFAIVCLFLFACYVVKFALFNRSRDASKRRVSS